MPFTILSWSSEGRYANTSTDDYLVVVIPDLFTNATKALDPLQISILDENGTPYQLFTSAKSGYSVFFAEYDSAPFGIQLYAVLAETGVDMTAIGRGHLVNPRWGLDVAAGQDPGRCLDCPECLWETEPERCPGRKLKEQIPTI